MDMTPNELKEIVKSAVTEALDKQELTCACGLPPDAQRELCHVMAVFRNLGGEGPDGYAKGAEVFRDNSRFVTRCRSVAERTGTIIWGVIILGVCGIGATIGGMGFWEWIKRGGGD